MIELNEVKKISEEFGTPSFIFDLEVLKNRVTKMREITEGKYHLCYSIKANPFLIPTMTELVDNLEVCSPGELAICEALHVPAEMIIYSGVNKGYKDVSEAFDYGVIHFTAESIHHMELVSRVAEEKGRDVCILPRLTSGTQFGMSKEDLVYLIENRNQYPHVQIEGIHYFVGTQRKKLDRQRKELAMLKELFAELRNEYQIELKKLEYGPGLPVPLFEGEDFSDTLQPMKELQETLSEVTEWAELTVEMGRFIATECGTYITGVADMKSEYCILDGGMNHVNYVGQMMGMKNPVIRHIHTAENRDPKEWTLCGSLCTTNDVMVRKITLEGLTIGDILSFENIGAYSVTEGIYLFLSRTMPKVILRYGEGEYKLVRDALETSNFNTPVVE